MSYIIFFIHNYSANWRVAAFTLLSLFTFSACCVHKQPTLFWSDSETNTLSSSTLAGNCTQNIIKSIVGNNGGMALDSINNKLYFVSGNSIKRSTLDGSQLEDFIEDTGGNPIDIAIDQVGQYLYWTDSELKSIGRASLTDSSFPQKDFLTGLSNPIGIAVQNEGGRQFIYWVDIQAENGKIKRIRIDAPPPFIEDIVAENLVSPDDINIDEVNGLLYWSDTKMKSIHRLNLRASLPNSGEVVIDNLDNLFGFAISPSQNKLYWSESNSIKSKSLANQSPVKTLVENLNEARNITLDEANKMIYWATSGSDLIAKAKLDGSNIDTLYEAGLIEPNGIALDYKKHEIYWIERQGMRIRKTNWRRSNTVIENVIDDITSLKNVNALALDIPNKKLYWTDLSTNTIWRANMNGTNSTKFISEHNTNIERPIDLALDLENRRIYWLEVRTSTTQKTTVLRYTDLDNPLSYAEIFIPVGDIALARGIALNLRRQRIYISSGDRIFETDMLGNIIRKIAVPGGGQINHLEVDEERDIIYWTNTRNGIQSVDIRHLQSEDNSTDITIHPDKIITIVSKNLANPYGIALKNKR